MAKNCTEQNIVPDGNRTVRPLRESSSLNLHRMDFYFIIIVFIVVSLRSCYGLGMMKMAKPHVSYTTNVRNVYTTLQVIINNRGIGMVQIFFFWESVRLRKLRFSRSDGL